MSIEVNPDWWKTMFDDVYLLTDARSVDDHELTGREVDVICETVPLRPGQAILDLCGGHGRHSLELCNRGFSNCTLLDYSGYLIQKARKTAKGRGFRMDFIQSDARDTGLPSGSFDHVLIMGNSLGYIQEPSADIQILTEACRVLRSGGWLLVDVTDGAEVERAFNPSSWHEVDSDLVVCREREIAGNTVNAREMVISKQKGMIRDRTYAIRLYDAKGLAEMIQEAGFVQVRVRNDFSPHQKKGDYGFMNKRMVGIGRKV